MNLQLIDGTRLAEPEVKPSPRSTGRASSGLAIPFGTAGVGGIWQELTTLRMAPRWPAEVAFGVCTTLWLTFGAIYAVAVLRHLKTKDEVGNSPVHNPSVVYIPLVGVLLSAHYIEYLHDVARALVVVFVMALGVLAIQLLSRWLRGDVPPRSFQPGSFLPTVAAAFISSIGLSFSGWSQAALAAFGAGVFLWLIVGGLIFGSLFAGPRLVDAAKPTFALLVAPPATGGIAWFLIADHGMDSTSYLLLGILIIMLGLQVPLMADYRALRFNLGFWAFAFPASSSANFVMRWLSSDDLPAWRVWCWSLAALATAFVAGIGIATVRQRATRPRTARVTPAGSSTETTPTKESGDDL
jgi:tellurite resistance protein